MEKIVVNLQIEPEHLLVNRGERIAARLCVMALYRSWKRRFVNTECDRSAEGYGKDYGGVARLSKSLRQKNYVTFF